MAQEIDYAARVVKITKPVLTSFMNLDEPKRVSKSPKEEPKYSASFEIEPDSADLTAIKNKIVAVAQAQWPGKNIGELINSGALITPLHSGDAEAEKAIGKGKKREWSRGLKILNARTQKAPNVGIIRDGQILENLSAEQIKALKKDYFYTGVKCFGQVSMVAYEAVGDGGKPGVTAYLDIILSTGKGEKLISGGPSATEAFSGYIGLESDEDPTAGASTSAW